MPDNPMPLDDEEVASKEKIQETLRRYEDEDAIFVTGWGLLVPQPGATDKPINRFDWIRQLSRAGRSNLVVNDFEENDASDILAQEFLRQNLHSGIAYASSQIGSARRRILLSRPIPVTELSWDNKPQRKEWSNQLFVSVSEHMAKLDAGNPDVFIPGYARLKPELKGKFWAELFIAVAKFELP